MSTYETILLASEAGLVWLTLNRPDRANSISRQLAHEVVAAIDEVEADPECRVLIITGAGRHFCGGRDLRDPARPSRRVPTDAAAHHPRGLYDALASCRLPVIAAINGAAMGGGCEMALACDIRVMADTATIGVPEIQFGALPMGGGTQRLPRLVGPGVAKEMIFSGMPMGAAEAHRVGLVNKVVPAADLVDACVEVARVCAERPAYALSAAKSLVDRGSELPLAEALELERVTVRSMATPEERRAAREGAATSQPTYARIFR